MLVADGARIKWQAVPGEFTRNEGAWYADICVPGNTAYLILGERSLARLAEIVGDNEMAARRAKRIEKAVKAMRDHMWDARAGTFLAVKRDSLEKIPVATIGSRIPLAAEVPTHEMAKRMAEVLASPAWQTPLPIPTVDRTDKRWESGAFWRGDVWPPTNYQRIQGEIYYRLRRHVDAAGLGEVLGAPLDVILDDHNVLQPDILFISGARREIYRKKNITGPPDVCVEVDLSPGSERLDRLKKLELYARFAVPHYWIVDTEARTTEEYVLEGDVYRARSVTSFADEFRPVAFPGFALTLGTVPLPD